VNDYRASWGEDLIDTTTSHTRVSFLPAAGQWTRLEVLAGDIGAAGKSLTGMSIKLFDGQAWFDRIGTSACSVAGNIAAPPLPASDILWFDEQLPAGAVASSAGAVTSWQFTAAQHVTGATSVFEPKFDGLHYHYFRDATQGFTLQAGDVLVTYVLVDPCNPPREILFEWNNGDWEHRAYWGDDLIPWGNDQLGAPPHFRMGAVPEGGQWVRLEIPAWVVGLEGSTIVGASYNLWGGQAWFDHVGKIARANVAFGKTATQSSTPDGRPASIAVDGTRSTSTVAHTGADAEAWWQVDLGSVQPIDDVVITSTGALSDFWLFVSDDPFSSTDLSTTRQQSGVSGYHYQAGAPLTLGTFVHRTGRYVRVQLTTTNTLSLGEVEVWAPPTNGRVNLAGGRIATQSHTYDSVSGPEAAVNGNLGTRQRDYTVSVAEAGAPQSWWQVDLGSVQPVSAVDLVGRFDCCPEQLANFYLFLSDAPFASDDVATIITQPGVSTFYVPAPHIGYLMPMNRTARYVRVAFPNASALSITETQVWSQAPSLAPLKRSSDR
jgi:hypothetical protein